MAKRDYYQVLGLARDSSQKQIKAAYRKLARKYHPDVNKATDAAGRFREATEAYEALSDTKKRKMYDQFGHTGPQGGFAAASAGARAYQAQAGYGQAPGGVPFDFSEKFSGSGGGRAGFMGMGLEDILDALRGRGRSRRAKPARGRDVESPLTIDFLSAVRGMTATLQIRGARGSETLHVKIPPGVHEGSRIRVRDKGEAGPAGRGDLYIVIGVRPHPYFRRDGDDVIVEVPIGIDEAALGAKVDVPTIDGMTTVTVPPGTGSSRRLRLRGKGVAVKGRTRGDQYVAVKIVPPPTISESGADLLREFGRMENFDPRGSVPWK